MPETTTPAAIPLVIERTVELRAAPDRLWRALTEADELAQWFGQRCAIDLRPGGEAWFDWDEGGLFHARVEIVEAVRRLVVRWATEEGRRIEDGPSTVMEWTIEPGRAGGSVLHLRETGFTAPDSRFGNVHGWIDELHDLLGHLSVEPWQAGIRRTYELRSAPERVWKAIATIPGLDGWFGPTVGLEIRAGSEGWFDWPKHGRFAVRIEAVEAPRYLAWSWTPHRDVRLPDASEILRNGVVRRCRRRRRDGPRAPRDGLHGPGRVPRQRHRLGHGRPAGAPEAARRIRRLTPSPAADRSRFDGMD